MSPIANLPTRTRIHFVGVGGAGLSAIAHVFKPINFICAFLINSMETCLRSNMPAKRSLLR